MIFVGIDPGLDGAVAVLNQKGVILSVTDTPTLTVKKAKGHKRVYVQTQMAVMLDAVVLLIHDTEHEALVMVENVHAMPKQGVTSMFSMGTGFGIWLGIIAALRLPSEMVEPRQWKKEMKIPTASDKSVSIVRALQLFPDAQLSRKKDHGRADALLLAEYGRRKTVR